MPQRTLRRATFAILVTALLRVHPAQCLAQPATPSPKSPDKPGRGQRASNAPPGRNSSGILPQLNTFQTDVPEHPFTIVLVRPTRTSITVSIVSNLEGEGFSVAPVTSARPASAGGERPNSQPRGQPNDRPNRRPNDNAPPPPRTNAPPTPALRPLLHPAPLTGRDPRSALISPIPGSHRLSALNPRTHSAPPLAPFADVSCMPHAVAANSPLPPAPVDSHPAPHLYSTALKYTDRITKARYIASKYAPILSGSVLDVGCDAKHLRALLPATATYTGIDMNDTADYKINLDQQDLPFPDRAFDTILCADVLEHLERIHAVFDELCRIARSHIIIALPNPYRNFLQQAHRNAAATFRHYGLPTHPPADRHRWFFGADDAARFIRERGELNHFFLEHLDVDEHGLPPALTPDGINLVESWNVRAGTTWAVIRRLAA